MASASSRVSGSCRPRATSCSAGCGPSVSTASSRDFYFRQLWDAKGSALVDVMDASAMAMYARLCGWTLAKAHARSGDAIAIAAYLGTSTSFDDAMATFAETYADQNELDYAALVEAVALGTRRRPDGAVAGRRLSRR